MTALEGWQPMLSARETDPEQGGDLKQHPPQNLLPLTFPEKREEMAGPGLTARGKAHTTVQLSWPPGWALAPASCCSLAGL